MTNMVIVKNAIRIPASTPSKARLDFSLQPTSLIFLRVNSPQDRNLFNSNNYYCTINQSKPHFKSTKNLPLHLPYLSGESLQKEFISLQKKASNVWYQSPCSQRGTGSPEAATSATQLTAHGTYTFYPTKNVCLSIVLLL